MKKPIYLPPPPAEIRIEEVGDTGIFLSSTEQFKRWTPNRQRAEAQLTEIRHREAQIAATIGILIGAFITLVLTHTFP